MENICLTDRRGGGIWSWTLDNIGFDPLGSQLGANESDENAESIEVDENGVALEDITKADTELIMRSKGQRSKGKMKDDTYDDDEEQDGKLISRRQNRTKGV